MTQASAWISKIHHPVIHTKLYRTFTLWVCLLRNEICVLHLDIGKNDKNEKVRRGEGNTKKNTISAS